MSGDLELEQDVTFVLDIRGASLAFAAACVVSAGAACSAPRTNSGSASVTTTSSATALPTTVRGTDPDLAVAGNGFSVTASRLSGTGQADLGRGIILAVPPTAAAPTCTPQNAFDALVADGAHQSRFALGPPKVELALFTDLQTGDIRADGTVKLFWTDVLVWAFRYKGQFPERNAPPPPGSTPAPARMTEMDVLVVVDATTGRRLTELDGITLTPRT